MDLIYKKGNMFDNLDEKSGCLLVHSTNIENVWGAGVALAFAEHFPNSEKVYNNYKNTLGDGYAIVDKIKEYTFYVCCLNTGSIRRRVPQEQIAIYTYAAIKRLLSSEGLPEKIVIHSPKINAGLFRVPWHLTEKAIKEACEDSGKDVEWIVWEL